MNGNKNTRVAFRLLALVSFMGVMAYASVPLYNWFCAVTGYGGTTAVADGSDIEVLDQTIVVRFDGSLERDMPWTFKPVEHKMEIRIGEVGLAFYEAHNPTNRPIAGQAGYNVAPFTAGEFFSKIDCFCFTEQVLEPGETVLMPVSFYVDPAIVEDLDGRHINSITLSYTFFEIDLPEDEISYMQSLDDETDTALN